MRLVRLKLRDSVPFWILNPIVLQKGKEVSPLLDIDILTKRQVDIINKSIYIKELSLYDADGNLIDGNLDNVNVVNGNHIVTDDIEEEAELYPQIMSVTVPEDEEDNEELGISDEAYGDAQILLTKNGNSIKKIITSLPENDENFTLLKACMELEVDDKNRAGVVESIFKAMKAYEDG